MLEAGLELMSHLSSHSCRDDVLMVREKLAHRFRIPDRQLAQSPGEGFYHHVVAVGDEAGADIERTWGVAGAAGSAEIERHRRDQGGTPPEAIRRCRPAADRFIGDEAPLPRRS